MQRKTKFLCVILSQLNKIYLNLIIQIIFHFKNIHNYNYSYLQFIIKLKCLGYMKLFELNPSLAFSVFFARNVIGNDPMGT